MTIRTQVLRALTVAVATTWLCAAVPAFAAGSNSDSPVTATKADPDWTAAKAAIAAKDYDRAVPLLQKVVAEDPKNADAFNYLGYTHARAGKHDEAIAYYEKALAIDPAHRGANEYLGELYLKMGNLTAAEQRLEVLDDACFFGCTEYDLLKKAVADYKANGEYVSGKGL